MRLWVALLVGVSAAGCDPIATISGRVVRAPDAPADGRAYEDAAPIGAAEVTIQCPGMVPAKILQTSDASGRMAVSTVGGWSSTCTLSLSAAGYEDKTLSMENLCPHGSGKDEKYCAFVSFQAELNPKPGTTSSVRGPPATPRTVPVRIAAQQPSLTVFTLVDEVPSDREAVRRQAWDPVCNAPCDAQVQVDARLGVALGDRVPIEPVVPPRLAPNAYVRVSYDDRQAWRDLGRVLGLAGIAAGVTLYAAGLPGDNQPLRANNIALLTGGGLAVIGGVALVGLLPQRDKVSLTVVTPF
jgi:hypothetical protein